MGINHDCLADSSIQFCFQSGEVLGPVKTLSTFYLLIEVQVNGLAKHWTKHSRMCSSLAKGDFMQHRHGSIIEIFLGGLPTDYETLFLYNSIKTATHSYWSVWKIGNASVFHPSSSPNSFPRFYLIREIDLTEITDIAAI